MVRTSILVTSLFLVIAGTANAALIDLDSRGLRLGAEIASSASMSIIDIPPLDLGFPVGVIPGFFQAIDTTSSPAVELNTGDGVSFNLSITPGYTGSSTAFSGDGDRQLELLFGSDVFARLVFAAGDTFDDILTGSLFSDASITVWELEDLAAAQMPVPNAALLLLGGCFSLALSRKRSHYRFGKPRRVAMSWPGLAIRQFGVEKHSEVGRQALRNHAITAVRKGRRD